MLMYANAAIMNPIRFLCVQKYAKLPGSNLMIRGEKRTSALEMSSPPLPLELPCTGLGCRYTAKLSAPAKSWLLLLPGKERHCGLGSSEVALTRFTRLQWGQRYSWWKPTEKQRLAEHDHPLYIFRSSHSLVLQNPRTAQVGRAFERSLSPTVLWEREPII